MRDFVSIKNKNYDYLSIWHFYFLYLIIQHINHNLDKDKIFYWDYLLFLIEIYISYIFRLFLCLILLN